MRHIGPYQVLGELGRGGSAVVLRAVGADGRPLAIKLLHAGSAATELQRERFVREAEALSRLRHPNVVSVHGGGVHEGCPYLVLDHVDGESLQALLDRRGPLDPRVAVRLVRQVALALEHAHAQRLLHRDVKPDNVLLGKDGAALLTDFGLVKDLAPDAQGAASLTKSGTLLGTPGYWPPEQALGQRAAMGPASDVYALGATLFACLTGGPPFRSASLAEELDRIVTATPLAPSRAPRLVPVGAEVPRRAIDRALDAIVLRCLAKAPADRYPSAAALASELRGWLQQERDGVGPRRVVLVSLGACVVAALAVAAGLRATRATPELVGTAPTTTTVAPEVGPVGPTTTPETPAVGSSARTDVRDLHTRGIRLAQEGKLQEGLALLDEALALAPDDVPALRDRSQVLLQVDPTRAITDCERLMELSPLDGDLWATRGVARHKLGQLPDALKDYDFAVGMDPECVEARMNRGLLRGDELGDPHGALEDFDVVVRLQPDRSEAWSNRAKAWLSLSEPRKALADADQALKVDRRDHLAWQLRGAAHAVLLDHAAAAEDFAQAIAIDPTPRSLLNHAVAVLDAKLDPRRAVASAEQALTHDLGPMEGRAWETLAQARRAAGQRDTALEAAGQALAHAIDADAARAVGPLFESLEARPEARRAYDRALELRPDDVMTLHMRAGVLALLGDRPAALADLERALRLRPTFADAWLRRAHIRRRFAYQPIDERPLVRADLDKAIELDPRSGSAHEERADLRSADDPRGALQDAERAIELDPELHVAWRLAGLLRARLDDRPGAIALVERGLATFPPGSRGAAALAEALEQLRASGP